MWPGLWAPQEEVSGLDPSLRASCSLIPRGGWVRGGSLAGGGQALHGPVSSPSAGPFISSRPAWWLAAGHLSLHAEEDG